ncbi:hypothetical protein [Luteimicrobium album]|uniref:hypothetical protein n=1 Tax=Luteimicrobium album TaxID=1054550 RepID=UPI0032AFB56A
MVGRAHEPLPTPDGTGRPHRIAPTATRATLWGLAVVVPLAFLVIFFAWPVLTLVGKGFVVDGHLDLGGFGEVFSTLRTWRIVGLTLGQAVLGTVLSVLLGVPGAYVLFRCRWPGRGLVRALVTVPFVLPTVVVGVAFRSLLVEGARWGSCTWTGRSRRSCWRWCSSTTRWSSGRSAGCGRGWIRGRSRRRGRWGRRRGGRSAR